MKYRIVIKKLDEQTYAAMCPIIGQHVRATGTSVQSALGGLQQDLLCRLHDPAAEFEIVMTHQGKAGGINADQGIA